MRPTFRLAFYTLLAGPLSVSIGGELIRLNEANYAATAPAGKESDAIYGDYVLRNDKIIAVVADPVVGRKANMTTQRVGGCIIDLTSRENQNDQLTCYYPGGLLHSFRKATIVKQSGSTVELRCETTSEKEKLRATVIYTLNDGDEFITVTREVTNLTSESMPVNLSDVIRADRTFKKPKPGATSWLWLYDSWFRQGYGLTVDGWKMATDSDDRRITIRYAKPDDAGLTLEPKQSAKVISKIFPAENIFQILSIERQLRKVADEPIELQIVDPKEQGVSHAEFSILDAEKKEIGRGYTDAKGQAKFRLEQGEYKLQARALGYGDPKSWRAKTMKVKGPAQWKIHLVDPALLDVQVTDDGGKFIPCKLQFIGMEGTTNPNLGPNVQGPGVGNLYYSHNGKFTTPMPVGKYGVLVSYGPEYDLATMTIEMTAGKTTPLVAKLHHSVQTSGWISSDLHSHSTPSGDNVTTTHGRILNHLAENIEFAPCTEHNRLFSYSPILKELGCERILATCVGLELTGQPLPLNHQNAFPLVMHFGMQDNGAPVDDVSPEVQIKRLAEWQNKSEKFVQTNHPDIGWMYFDKNGDGVVDAGFSGMFQFQNGIEVWGNGASSMKDESVLTDDSVNKTNRLFHWLLLLNLGHRFTAVANSDAHYTDHGTGWVRNFVKSSTDDPAKVDIKEMVANFKHGHCVISNGPFLDVKLLAGDKKAIPGDDVPLPQKKAMLKVQVQCPNWFDINRVQVLVNGRAKKELNFTRAANPTMFASGVMKFDQQIPLEVAGDAHIIVTAIGEGLDFGDVYGPSFKGVPPTAISNPIFLDVDGNGFKANGDTLDRPIPARVPTKRELQDRMKKAAKDKKKEEKKAAEQKGSEK